MAWSSSDWFLLWKITSEDLCSDLKDIASQNTCIETEIRRNENSFPYCTVNVILFNQQSFLFFPVPHYYPWGILLVQRLFHRLHYAITQPLQVGLRTSNNPGLPFFFLKYALVGFKKGKRVNCKIEAQNLPLDCPSLGCNRRQNASSPQFLVSHLQCIDLGCGCGIKN